MKQLYYRTLTSLRRLGQRLFNTATLGVKALVINAEQEVLLVMHTYVEGWHLPGGGVDPGETPTEAVLRELKEETGVIGHTPRLFALYFHRNQGACDYPILYIIQHFETMPQAMLSPEIKEAKWFSIQALPEALTKATRQRLAEYFHQAPLSEQW